MKKLFTLFLTFILISFAFSVPEVSAKVIADQKGNVIVAKTEVIDDDLFIGAQTAEIDGTVNGDVFIGAQTVIITGVINGNLHIGTNTLDLGGAIKGNVYAGAQNVLVNGSVIDGSLLIGAATVNIDKDSIIGGSLLTGAGTLSMDTQVKRSVYAGTGKLTIGGNTKIGKDLYYASGKNQEQVNISGDAKITGTTYKSEVKTSEDGINTNAVKKQIPAFFGTIKLFTTIVSFLGALVVGFLYFKLFNKHFVKTGNIISNSFWKCLGIGFLISIAFIPGFIILLTTVIGIPVAGLALITLLLCWYLAKIVVSSALGNRIVQKFGWKMSIYWVFALGLSAVYICKSIPVVGFLFGLLVVWVGIGALVLSTFSKSE